MSKNILNQLNRFFLLILVKIFHAFLLKNRLEEQKENGFSVFDLIRTKNIRKIFIKTSIIYAFTMMIYYGLAYNAAGLPGSLYINHSMNGIGNILATAISTERLSEKK